ncbi:DUF4192 domain-containing protein [Bifidobacterium sp. SMB2]|uniref:DUF4192 domain-containing protein n=1 Tax=Bifidobacterium saimiriisciurei TaxID=2661627 RepID=A0ABX0CE64_9BIFI|nr:MULTISPECIES: DUF4192 domain-containing protein [Bifidobacterium]NEG95831.1 DUF4192 domain-containing protein [Bifidobacterium sp. SMB2]NEH12100.1 DUF4192 domain-containing protein [Bifidobacterium saimiriisciurei]
MANDNKTDISDVGLHPLTGPYAREEDLRELRISSEHMDGVRDSFRRRRRAEGPSSVDGDWARGLIGAWTGRLAGEMDELDTDTVVGLCVGMGETLSMRDAVLLAVMEPVDERRLVELVAKPRDAHSVGLVYDTLTTGFEDASAVPNPERCQRGVDALAHMVCRVPVPYCVQPLAVLSFVLWWIGRDEQALACALHALSLDEQCMLASIVAAAIGREVRPAWRERENRE